MAGGYTPMSTEGAGETTSAITPEDTGALGGVAAATTGALSGLTAGGSDVLLGGLLNKGHRQDLVSARQQHPWLEGAGQIVGSLLPAFAAPESLLASSPAAKINNIGRTIMDAGEGAGAIGRAAYATAGAAAEGAAFGGGSYLSQVALEDKPLSAEGFVGAMGHGALFAAPIGGGLSLAGSALQRARSLFPQRQVTAAAAEAIDKEATSTIGQAVADGDQMAAAVRRQLGITEAKIGMAEAGEGTTRRMFGEADPQALGDQVTGGVDRVQMTSALRRYEASKAQLSDWIREEADPALEAALAGLTAPEVGQIGGRIEKTAGKFGEAELAAGTPVEPANRALMDALDSRARQVEATAVGKRPVKLGDAAVNENAGTGLEELQDQRDALGARVKAFRTAEERNSPEFAAALDEYDAADARVQSYGGSSSSSSGSPTSLESLLRGTKAELDAGKSLAEVSAGSKLRKDYVTSKELEVGKPLTRGAEPLPPAAPGEGFTRTDRAAGGSQGGSWYRDTSGEQWFGKHYAGDTDRLAGEHVANEIYRTFGVAAPETKLVEVGGKPMLMSREIKGRHPDTTAVLNASDIHKGFVVDAWLGNRDVIGTGKDNIIMVGDKASRIDAGGATIWRAQGADKTFAAKVSELEGMRDPSRQTGRVFGKLSTEDVNGQLKQFARDFEANQAKVERIIDESSLGDAAKAKIKTGLNDRAAWLQSEARGRPAELSDDEFNALAHTRQTKLTPEVERAMRNYSNNGIFAQVNAPLREAAGRAGMGGLKSVSKHLHETIQNIDSGIAASPAPRDMVVFRGVSGNRSTKAMLSLKPGDVYVDPGFGSTSYSGEIGDEYAKGFDVRKGVKLEISVPKGYPAMPIPSEFPKEREILLPRGGRYIVTSVEDEGGRRVIRMAVRQPDAAPAPAAVPPGFNLGGKDRYDNVVFNASPEVVRGLPDPSTVSHQTARDIAYVIRPSELAEAEIIGAPVANVPSAPPEGGWRPVEIVLHKDGKYAVAAGGDSLLAAAADDRPVVASIWPSSTKSDSALGSLADDIRKARVVEPVAPIVDAPSGLEGIARVQRDVAGQATAAGPDLESLLRGTKQQLDAGVAIKDVRPTAGDKTTHFDIASTGLRFSPETRTYHGTPEASPIVDAADMATGIGRRPASALAPEPRAGGLSDLDALLGGGKRDVTSILGKRSLSGDVPASSEEYAVRSAMGKRIMDSATQGARESLPKIVTPANANESIAAILTKRVGKNVDMGAGLARAAKAIGDFEAAGADLVEILGPAAPASAAEQAKAYRAASAGQADAAAASSARTAADVDQKLGPKVTGGALGKAADIGGAIEILHALGVHTPSLAAIPIIGPILSLFLKAKAVMGVIGRKGGSVGRSIEGTVAAKAAETRNRFNAATVSVLDAAGRGTKKASAMSAGPAVTLANKLFPGGADPKSKDPRVLYEARIDEISRALAPGAIDHAVGDRIQTSDPHLQDAIVSQVERGIKFLDGKAPKQTVLPGMTPGDGIWKPSKAAIEEWGKYVHAVNDPASVLEDLAKGHVTLEGAETLRVVYPKLFAEAQQMLLERAPQMQATLPYPRRVAISIMYQVPIDITMTPQHMQFLQPPPAAPAQPMPGTGLMPGPSGFTGAINLGQQTMTSLDRRAGA